MHQKIKFPHEGKVVTILAKTEADVAALKLTHNEIPVSPGFQVCMIYEDELNPKITNMMKGMNFMPGIGLGKDQQGPTEFIESKVPISKHGLGFQKLGKAGKAKRKSKKKKAMWKTFMEEGANYPYTDKPEPLLIADKLVPGFEIFAKKVNGIREPVVEEALVEELC